jgi:hypothetical protein
MSYSNDPSAQSSEPSNNSAPKKNLTGYIILIVLLLGTWAYFMWDKSKNTQAKEELQTKLTSSDSTNNVLQTEYNAALQRLDELTTVNESMDSLVKARNGEIEAMKSNIQKLLRKDKKSAADLAEAKRLIGELNTQINGYVQEIEKLKGENLQLQNEKTQLTTEKENLQKDIEQTRQEKDVAEKQLDVASTLVATNISMMTLDIRKGGKEVEREKARRVDMLRLTFDVFNRVGNDGEKELFVIITDPTGKVVSNAALGSGNFTTREEGDKLFTKKITVDFLAGKAVPVSMDWNPGANFVAGQYKAEIYNNGFLIGFGTRTLK